MGWDKEKLASHSPSVCPFHLCSLQYKSSSLLPQNVFGGGRLQLYLLCGHVSETHTYVCANTYTEKYLYAFMYFYVSISPRGDFFPCDSLLVGTKANLRLIPFNFSDKEHCSHKRFAINVGGH